MYCIFCNSTYISVKYFASKVQRAVRKTHSPILTNFPHADAAIPTRVVLHPVREFWLLEVGGRLLALGYVPETSAWGQFNSDLGQHYCWRIRPGKQAQTCAKEHNNSDKIFIWADTTLYGWYLTECKSGGSGIVRNHTQRRFVFILFCANCFLVTDLFYGILNCPKMSSQIGVKLCGPWEGWNISYKELSIIKHSDMPCGVFDFSSEQSHKPRQQTASISAGVC